MFILLFGFVCLFFIQLPNKIKILLLFILLIVQIFYFKVSFYIPTVNRVLAIDACIDLGGIWDEEENKCVPCDECKDAIQ